MPDCRGQLHLHQTGIVAIKLMKNPASTAVDDRPRKGLLSEIWKFLNRDVRTFKWWQQNKTGTKTYDLPPPEFMPVTEPAPEIFSEVDPRQIEALRIRREVLDWRDDFHFRITEAASQATKEMEKRVEHELANMNFLRLWLFTKASSEVLEGHIESCIRLELRRATQSQEAALRQNLLTWLPHRHESANIRIMFMWPKLEWDTRLALDFTADNRERILTVLGEMILGENGLADRYRQWATQYAGHILEMRHARSGSI